jgi:hypothetical protein
VPYQDGAGPWQWEEIRIPGTDPGCVERASRQMRAGEHLITRWSPALLRMQLDRWLWNDRPHLLVKQLWEYLCTYGYLPRLQDENVLLTTIADGLAYPDYFAYARSVSSAGRYEGLIFNQPATPSQIFLDGQSVLLKPEAAQAQCEADEARRRQLDEERRRREDVSGGPDRDEHRSSDRVGPLPPPPPPQPTVLRRFHGSLHLNSLRVGRDASNVAEEIVQHLAGRPGAEVEVTLEINAYLPEGAPDDVVRTVTENAATLRFTSQGFEEE